MIVLPRRLSDEVADRVRALIDEKNLEAGMKLPLSANWRCNSAYHVIHCARRWQNW